MMDGEMTSDVAGDLQLKLWIRITKFIARVLSLACSAVVIGLSGTTMNIFLTTKDLARIANFPPWAEPTILWPQILTLSVACVSFAVGAWVMVSYFRRGHRGAEKMSNWEVVAAVAGFIAMLAIWIAAGASLKHVQAVTGRGDDLWGWACNDRTPRKQLFRNKVNYDLVCIMQDWNFICTIIHVAATLMTAVVWGLGLWRMTRARKMRREKA